MLPFQISDLHFEPLKETHFSLLYRWLNVSHVKEYWDRCSSLQEVQGKFLDKIACDWQQAFIVSCMGTSFGYVQSYQAVKAGNGWWSDELDSTVGIDQFIGEAAWLGKGLGAAMGTAFSNWLLAQTNTEKVITDPSPHNMRAIRCYQKAGFRQRGIVTTPDGPAFLMDKTEQSY